MTKEEAFQKWADGLSCLVEAFGHESALDEVANAWEGIIMAMGEDTPSYVRIALEIADRDDLLEEITIQ